MIKNIVRKVLKDTVPPMCIKWEMNKLYLAINATA